jgi:hypothetical protein
MNHSFNSPHRPRHSACAAKSKAEELERLRSMTVAERIEAALAIKGRFREFKPVLAPASRP